MTGEEGGVEMSADGCGVDVGGEVFVEGGVSWPGFFGLGWGRTHGR